MTRTAFFLISCLCSTLAWGQVPPPLAHWSFDEAVTDSLAGRVERRDGVTGSALVFDGFTTTVIRKAAQVPAFAGGISVEAWLAPQEYSWNWTAIANQSTDSLSGFFFGINYAGYLGLSVAVEGVWKTVVSTEKIPLLKWSHVLSVFDPATGLRLYLDGRPVGALAAPGKLSPSRADLWLGASQQLMGVANTEREPSRQACANTRMVFDGLIDELNLYAEPLTDLQAQERFGAVRPAAAQPLRYRTLPAGPKNAKQFGAFYENLRYAEGWDALWRNSGPDVVVAFDVAPIRLVSWKGVSYAPCWVTENGHWFSNEFMERSVAAGCAESMSDKQARFSSVKILESNEARTVLYWRYSPVDIHYQLPFTDPQTAWGDWGEEIYTVYPDGVAVRKFIGWSGVPRKRSFLEWTQSLPILHPGQRPEDVLQGAPFVSVATLQGQGRDYHWPPKPDQQELVGANIQVVNYKSDYKPFLVLTDRKPRIWMPKYVKNDANNFKGMVMSAESAFWWWNHWPVAQIPNDGRVAPAADRPSHSWAANQDSEPWATTATSETQLMLCGLTRQSAQELIPLAKSWLRAPALVLETKDFSSKGYDATQRAYVLSAPAGGSSTLSVSLAASPESPLQNPALVIEGWGENGVQLSVNGKPAQRNTDFRYGFDRKIDRTDLIVWIQTSTDKPVRLVLSPQR